MHFFLSMRPPRVTAQEHKVMVRNGRPIFYDPPELREAKDRLMAELRKQAPETPMQGAIRLHTKWIWSHKGKMPEWKTTKPDTDNLNKMLKDCMTKVGFWNDDAQVCQEMIEKYWSEPEGIFISVEGAG